MKSLAVMPAQAGRYCLPPVVSLALDSAGCCLPVSLAALLLLRSGPLSRGSDDTLLITHRPASAIAPAISIGGSATIKAATKLANAANARMLATQSRQAATNRA